MLVHYMDLLPLPSYIYLYTSMCTHPPHTLLLVVLMSYKRLQWSQCSIFLSHTCTHSPRGSSVAVCWVCVCVWRSDRFAVDIHPGVPSARLVDPSKPRLQYVPSSNITSCCKNKNDCKFVYHVIQKMKEWQSTDTMEAILQYEPMRVSLTLTPTLPLDPPQL